MAGSGEGCGEAFAGVTGGAEVTGGADGGKDVGEESSEMHKCQRRHRRRLEHDSVTGREGGGGRTADCLYIWL